MPFLKRSIAFSLVLFLAACSGTPGQQAAATPRNPDVISTAELEQYSNAPVRQAIERLHPRFLRTRGTGTIHSRDSDRPVVYLGSTRMGGLEYLDQVATTDLREIRYLSASDASQRFGVGHPGGAIVLIPR